MPPRGGQRGGAGNRRSTSAAKNKDPLAHLASDGPRPVYALWGPERLLADEALEAIVSATLTTAVEFNQDILVGRDATATRIADAARMLPAFAPRRLVLVRDADKLTADTQAGLLTYLADPSPTTVLVFVATKLDARTKFYKALKKAGTVLKLDHPTAREMPRIVRARAEKIGTKIQPAAVTALMDAIGLDVGAVAAALEKLTLYKGPNDARAITADDVHAVVSHVREESIFLLSDAIGNRDKPGAMELLHGMLSASRGHPLALLGLIAGHWRRLTIARAMMDDRSPKAEIQSALGLPPFVVDKLIRQARAQDVGNLVGGLRAIAAADQAMKGGKLPAERVMERLVLTLT